MLDFEKKPIKFNPNFNFKMGDTTIEKSNDPKFLGYIYDKYLKGQNHLKKIRNHVMND